MFVLLLGIHNDLILDIHLYISGGNIPARVEYWLETFLPEYDFHSQGILQSH